MSQIYAVKLGGSIVSPSPEELFDFKYAAELKATLKEFTDGRDKFFLTVGGGSLMRQFRDLAMVNGINDITQLHWIGTTVNVLNAEVTRVSMGELADPGVIKYEEYFTADPLIIEKSIKVGGGSRPGYSGDVDAVLVGLKLGAHAIISLKDIDAVYTVDPKKDPAATPLEHLTWPEYQKIIGDPGQFLPGASYPIDPIASRMCIENHLRFIVIAGRDLANFGKVLRGEHFHGTVIE
jgi:uridylate kinase